MLLRGLALSLLISLCSSLTSAQKAEVTVTLNEQFFDALLDSVFQNFDPPEFPIASNLSEGLDGSDHSFASSIYSFVPAAYRPSACTETVKLLRDMNGVRTAVRFRDGKVYVPLAFSGGYAPPFVGCVDFAGWAESNIDLEFDSASQRLIGKARVLNVNLNGTGGYGGTLVAKMIQGSLDKKLNPIEILSLDKLSFGVPIQGSGNLRMKAVNVRPEVGSGVLNIRVEYQFIKG